MIFDLKAGWIIAQENGKTIRKWTEVISNCCGERDKMMSQDGPNYSDVGLCPKCKEHCEFVDVNSDWK